MRFRSCIVLAASWHPTCIDAEPDIKAL